MMKSLTATQPAVPNFAGVSWTLKSKTNLAGRSFIRDSYRQTADKD